MVFGLFGKSRFPKLTLGAEVGPYEAKTFVQQQKIKLDWKHGDEALAMFVPWLVQDQLSYYAGLPRYQAQLIGNLAPYLAAPTAARFQITDDVQPENYLLIGGTWHVNGIGSTRGSIGGPAGPEVDDARAEVIKALLHKVQNEARAIAACKHVIAFHEELGDEHNYKKRGGRVLEAWRLATGGAPAK